ncbi:hypothetical protein DTL42_01300 [Bremerella cremea]|uniref:Uncharacterized protein n=1 Tax=Bremerella cremea TaxID=1031537 RepID=A0A368KX24_9BACT|nr:hypothetical protein [Bremerella cremea]RCS55769.1 hypothetical protein DTL42_01300 [Bremerella cremea]
MSLDSVETHGVVTAVLALAMTRRIPPLLGQWGELMAGNHGGHHEAAARHDRHEQVRPAVWF